MWGGMSGGGGGGGWGWGSQTQQVGKAKAWATDAFLSEFCDHFADDLITSSEGFESWTTFQHGVEFLLKKLEDGETANADLAAKCKTPLETLKQAMEKSEMMMRKYASYQQWKMQYYLAKMLDDVAKAIKGMEKEGDFVLLPLLLPEVHDSGVCLVVEYTDAEYVRLTVVNPTATTHYHPKTVSEENPTKIKQQVALTISKVKKTKICSEAWWSCVMLGSKALRKEDVFYSHFLSWLTGKTHAEQIEEYHTEAYYATPAKSGNTVFWKSMVHALKYILRRHGLESQEVKFVRHLMKIYLLEKTADDLEKVSSIKFSSKKMIEAALQNTAMSISRNESLFQHSKLEVARHFVESLHAKLLNMRCDDEGRTAAPPLLDITHGWDHTQQPDVYPLMECHRRIESVEQFVGAATEKARAVPINFLRIPENVSTLEEALCAVNETTMIITRIVGQRSLIKNHALLVVSTLNRLFLEILPSPLGPVARQKYQKKCIWSDTPMRYGQQLHLIQRLNQLCEYYVSGIFSMDGHLENDGLRLTVVGCIAVIIDALVRVKATDKPSIFSVHLTGYKGKDGFAVSPGKYASQTANIQFVYPEALLHRAAIIDYYEEVADSVPSGNIIWKWEDGIGKLDKAAVRLFRQIAHREALPTNSVLNHMATHNEGNYSVLIRQFDEVKCFRNTTFFFKHLMNPSFPHKNDWLPMYTAFQRWDYREGEGFEVYAFEGTRLQTDARARFPSFATPGHYTRPHEVVCEEDVLHIKNLTTFNDVMGQRDSELLISYLTVPYMRIPLMLRFFATEDRISCLKQVAIQQMLSSALFEAGRFLHESHADTYPQQVPSEKEELVACPYGLLLNELFHSTDGVMEPLVKMVRLAAELDAGTVYNEMTTNVILFLIKLTARVHSYVSFACDIQSGKVPAAASLRGIERTPACLERLEEAYVSLSNLISTLLVPMLESWTLEAIQTAKESLRGDDVDKATALASKLYAHQIMLLRNVRSDDFTPKSITTILSSFAFLTTRYTWSTNTVPELELYNIITRHRRAFVRWLTTCNQSGLNTIMDSVVRVVTSSGGSREGDSTHNWGYLAGPDCVGRFARLDEDVLTHISDKGTPELLSTMQSSLGLSSLPDGATTIPEGIQEVELNINTVTLTFKNAHLRALPSEIAGDPNIFSVFAPMVGGKQKMLESMQCAIVEDAVNRLWVRLVGQDHDVQYWRTGDPRFAIPNDTSMRFYPDDLAETEKWVEAIFEPIRLTYFERSFWEPPIFILIQEHKLTADNSVAQLSAIDSQSGKKLKEVYVFRDFRCVHCYDVVSHGRRYYRRLVYTSNAHYCLQGLQPAVDRRAKPWASWGRHAAGDPDPDTSTEQACTSVILRHASHPENISKATETYVPPYLLHGLIPSCLLETHRFWQDPDDNIRGYPVEDKESPNKASHILWLHWREAQFDPTGAKNTVMQVFRFARAAAAPKSSEEAVLRSQKLKVTDEIDEEIALTRAKSYDETGNADLQAGAFRQSSTLMEDKTPAATIEDNNLMLINLMYARKGTPLHSLAKVLSRLELLSHVLVWTTMTDYDSSSGGPITVDLIQLPRLKLSFTARLAPDGTTYLLYSLDHAHLFVSNNRQPLVIELLQGVPHSLILSDANGAMSVLVPAVNVVRPVITLAPFSSELVLNRFDMMWLRRLDTRYYLYPVHVSLSFMFTPTLASALYLLLLRFFHRNYTEVFRLAGTIGTDMELTAEEHQIFQKLVFCSDSHPNAYACRSKISLLVSDSPVTLSWYPPEEVAYMLGAFNHVTVACRMTPSEERRLLYLCDMLEKKMDVIRQFVSEPQNTEGAQIIFSKLQEKSSFQEVTFQQRRTISRFYQALTTILREKLDVRIVREDLNRLLSTYNQHAQQPMDVYYSCLLHNRRQILEGEYEANNKGEKQIDIKFKVPPMGDDLKWNFYDDYNPHTVKAPGSTGKEKNDEGRVMTMSKTWDYFYCGAQVRKANQCRCRSCSESCGPHVGCPCVSCERYNATEGHLVRELIPVLDHSKSQRTLSFFEAFMWINEAIGRYASSKRNKEYPYLEKSTPCTLREGVNAFLRYYELLTGTTKVKICSSDSARDLATLLFHFSREARNPAAALGHMMHFAVATPYAWPRLPKFNRTSKQKMEQRTMTIYNGIWAQAASYQPKPRPEYAALELQTEETHSVKVRAMERTVHVPLHLTTILPLPRNTDCSHRVLSVPDQRHLRLLGNETEHLAITQDLLETLATVPLNPVMEDGLVGLLSREEQKLPPISKELPFDLSKHEDSRKTVARDMLKRIEADMADFARQQNDHRFAKLLSLKTEEQIRTIVCGRTTPELKNVRQQLEGLYERTVKLRDDDGMFLAYAMPAITRTANYIEFGEDRTSSLLFLRRFAGKEATLSLDFLLASLCSDTSDTELQQLNPFVTKETSVALFALITVAVLRANRVGHANRVCEVTKELLGLLSRADSFPPGLENRSNYIDACTASITQKADALAQLLLTPRVYIDRKTLAFDPRFLIFEFTWNIVLRDRQREQILEMYDSIVAGQSSVKQMIMGAGKTTVVGPLLALMVANGNNMVMQVVPPALLDFTRAVLRNTFSSVLQKQIFTFDCDRATEVDSEALSKFEHAKQNRGIVVTTPSSIKSIFLKYIEGLDRVADEGRQRSVEMEKENVDLLNVLQMWRKGVLIMDEVDLLLHPLKSELNFPIGAKHNIDFTPTRWKLPIHLIDTIFYYHTRRITTSMKESPDALGILQRFRAKVKLGLEQNALQEMPHLTLLNVHFYDEVLKPILAEWTLLFLKAQHLTGLSDADTVAYMCKRPHQKENPELAARVEKLESDHIKMLNLSYEWLNCFMPHVMQKIDRVSFGIMNNEDMKRAREEHPNMPRSRFVTAIPFVGKDLPSQSSEFAHPDIVIGLTVLAYRYEGLRTMDFTVILREIHAAVEKEVGRFSQRRTNIMYQRWVQAAGGKILASYNYGAKQKKQREEEMGMQPSESVVYGEDGEPLQDKVIYVLPLKLMKQANQQEIDKLFKLFRRTAEPIQWYLCESIFPEYMRHQQMKLSSSGQELGGTMIFQRRLGFSGTPSDLLPIELGRCGYEAGTDGQLIYTLTDPRVMGYAVAEGGWTVRSLLDRIATSDPPYHALIDTGALITGMSNLQVAQYLLKHGLPHMEGVVFLDEFDRKMILVRATGRVLKLAECGIPKVKRFAFYDQVHTTGMDIEHTPNAVAVQTLGKDMTFRDFSQGAYRMRGIGQGQLVHLLIIPEVYDLINRTLKCIRTHKVPQLNQRAERDVLVDVTSWLLVNSIRSEHTQHNQLCIQSCANVWRKEAFSVLSERVNEFKVKEPPSEGATKALSVYREAINFEISDRVPNIRMFSEAIAEFVGKNSHLIMTEEGQSVVKSILDQTKREDEVENPVIDVQMVQEQEEEKEAEQEQEKEQEIEIEKFVDLAYSRDEEQPAPWRLETLTNMDRAVQFYKLQDFHLYKRRSIDVPDSIMLSKNHFNPKWSGHRRMKNVIVTMEWIPSLSQLSVRSSPSCDYGCYDNEQGRKQLEHTLQMLIDHQSKLTPSLVADLLNTALHIADPNSNEMQQVVTRIMAKSGEGKFDPEVMYSVLAGNYLRLEEQGRHTVCLNLAEAETLRRLIHMRQLKRTFLEGSDCAISLNLCPSGNATLDSSSNFVPARTNFFPARNFQVLRYFDCDVHYSPEEFGLLLRSLHNNTEKLRQAFFQQVISTRRRSRQRWETTPIALLFTMKNAFTLLQQRTVGLCIRRELEAKELHLGDAYIAFNSSHSGLLSPDELWGSMRYCRLSPTPDEVLDFIDVADTHCEGNIQYSDFICVLTGNRELEEADSGDQPDDAQGKKLPTIEPHGAEELKQARAERVRLQRAQEAEANKEMESETQRVMDEIEAEQISEDISVVNDVGNPLLEQTALTFGFNHPLLPKLVVPVGAKVRRPSPPPPGSDEVRNIEMHSNSGLKFNFRMLKRLAKATTLGNYCLSTEFKLPRPKRGDPKNGVLYLIGRMGKVLNLFNWAIPVYRFGGYGNAGAPPFEVEYFGASGGEDAQEEEKGLFKAPPPPQLQSSYGSPQPVRKGQTASSGSGGGKANEIMHVFPEPKPGKCDEETLSLLKLGDLIIIDGEKTNNSIEGVTYEWVHVSFPVSGWIVKEKNGRSYWEQLATAVSFAEKGFIVDHAPLGTSSADHQGTFDEGTGEEEDVAAQGRKVEEEEEDDCPVELTHEVGDLLEALRKAKRLKPGDKVIRNRDSWEKGNEDGGEGTVGKVLKVESDKVEVQWPSGNKGKYLFGSRGIFELIKVGEADEDDEGEQRETMNDERWLPELRKGGQKCNSCSAPKLEPSNWFRCNHCESYHLCKKCFRNGSHSEHDFTDMNALNNARSNEISPGAYVRIKLSVTNPKYGWDGTSAKPGSTGTVLEVDHDENWATVELENANEEEWRADLDEIEVIEEQGGDEADEAQSQEKVMPYNYIMSFDPTSLPFVQSLIDTARLAREGKYKVGDRVKVKVGSYMYPGEVKACLPGKEYALNIEGQGATQVHPERSVHACNIKVGDRVRYKRNKTSFVYSCPWDEKERKKRSGTVQKLLSGGSDYVKIVAQFDDFGNLNIADKDLDVIGNGKWTFTRTIDGQTDVIPLPTSSNVVTERAFEDGTANVQVFIRDDVYNIDLSTNEVRKATALVGKLTRDPPEPFVKGEAAARLDDGNPHVVSLLVKGDSVAAYCDGKPAPVSYTGSLQSIKDREKYKVALSHAMALVSHNPLYGLYSPVSSEMARASVGSQGPSFPMRTVHWMRLDWDSTCTGEEVQAWHSVIDVAEAWVCRECGTQNSRQLDACDDCKVPRVRKQTKDADNKNKFRSGLAKSRDAQAVRQKLQGKLRAQYQRELDFLDEAAAAAEATAATGGAGSGGRGPKVSVVGPSLPA